MKSVMSHNFSQIPSVDIQRSTFDRSHGYKTTFDADYLIPFFVDEALPGDTFSLHPQIFTRLTTPITPLMDNMFLDTFYFAVPYRLVWDNWQRFNGEVIDPNDPDEQHDFLIPQLNSGAGFDLLSMFDYMGIPTSVPNINVNSLHFRAYNLIYNEWFRDENLCSPARVNRSDGGDLVSDFPLRKRAKKHDYFTSCLPWAQKGDTVGIGLAGTVPVIGDGSPLNLLSVTGGRQTYIGPHDTVAGNTVTASLYTADGTSFDFNTSQRLYAAPSGVNVGLVADLSGVSSIDINSLRQAFQIQRMLEKDARGGTRYTEILRAHFRTVSPDARLQRPEYLGSTSDRIHFTPVAQNSATDSTSPQGNLAAYATGGVSARGFSKSFTEHCLIIGLLNVRADITYQQGLNRLWSRQTRYDYYWPSLAHLGEQAVLNKEIYAQGNDSDEAVFGYQERYAEYRYKPSLITGLMRSTAPQSLDVWHLSEEFTSLPTLSAAWIESNTPVDRIIAVPSQPQFIADMYLRLKCSRPMPVYSVPGLIDHF